MNRQALLSALKTAAPALGDDAAALPALSHFCFDDDSFYAFNDIIAVIVGFPTGLKLGLHGATLLGVLSAARAEDIEFKLKASACTLVGGGRVEFPVLAQSDFLFRIPDDEPILSVPLSAEIKRAVEVCLISVAEDSMRPEYNGVTLRIGKSGTTLFSTDNVTATRIEPTTAKVPARKDAALVLPKQAAELVLKLFPKEGPAPKIHIGEKSAIIDFGGEPNVTLFTKLLGSPSSKFDSIFEAHVPDRVVSIPEGFSAEIEKAKVLTARESLKECSLTANKGDFSIEVEASLGKMKTTLGVEDKKLAGAVVVDPDLVARMLPHVKFLAVNDERSLVLGADGLSHVISAVPRAEPAAEPPAPPPPRGASKPAKNFEDDDIPF